MRRTIRKVGNEQTFCFHWKGRDGGEKGCDAEDFDIGVQFLCERHFFNSYGINFGWSKRLLSKISGVIV